MFVKFSADLKLVGKRINLVKVIASNKDKFRLSNYSNVKATKTLTNIVTEYGIKFREKGQQIKTISECLYYYFDDENPFDYLTPDELNEAYGVFVARRSGRAFRETDNPKSNATLSTEAKHSKRKGSGTNAVNADDPVVPLLSSKRKKSKTAAPVAVPPVAVAPLAVAVAVVKAVAVSIETQTDDIFETTLPMAICHPRLYHIMILVSIMI